MIDHLSPSTVQSYRNCGRQVYFRKVMGVENPVHYAMTEYGSAMHQAIEALYKEKLSKADYIARFEKRWEELSRAVNNWKNDSKEYLMGEGRKACEDFYDTVYGKYNITDVEQEFKLERGEGKLPVLCYADAITDDGIIIDYKFGRGFSGMADSKSYLCNMATYAWAYYEKHGKIPKIVFVKQKWKKRKDKETGKYMFSHDCFVVDEKTLTKNDLDYYKSVYDGVEIGMNAGVWLPASDECFLCKSCGYRLNGMCDRKEDDG